MTPGPRDDAFMALSETPGPRDVYDDVFMALSVTPGPRDVTDVFMARPRCLLPPMRHHETSARYSDLSPWNLSSIVPEFLPDSVVKSQTL